MLNSGTAQDSGDRIAPKISKQEEVAAYLREASLPKIGDREAAKSEMRDQSVGDSNENSILSKMTFGILGSSRSEDAAPSKLDAAVEKGGDAFQKMSSELPSYLEEAKSEVNKGLRFSPIAIAKKLWGVWEKFADIAPSPWNTVAKFGVPVAAGTCALIFYQAVVQLGIEALKFGAGLAQPLAIGAAFLIPAFSANRILELGEKLFKADPVSGWKRQAILRPAQGILLLGAAIWMQTLDLNMLTYGAWAGAAIGTALLASKLVRIPAKTLWPAVTAALVLPWSHYLTQRTYDITVLSAGPDPEVGAWNVGTDLSVVDHWKEMTLLGEQKPPSGHSGMVMINRDVPLYLPPHRTANAFNSDFSTLIGKQVRVTTIGGWLKFLSPKLQPTIVKYEVIGDAIKATPVVDPTINGNSK